MAAGLEPSVSRGMNRVGERSQSGVWREALYLWAFGFDYRFDIKLVSVLGNLHGCDAAAIKHTWLQA